MQTTLIIYSTEGKESALAVAKSMLNGSIVATYQLAQAANDGSVIIIKTDETTGLQKQLSPELNQQQLDEAFQWGHHAGYINGKAGLPEHEEFKPTYARGLNQPPLAETNGPFADNAGPEYIAAVENAYNSGHNDGWVAGLREGQKTVDYYKGLTLPL